MIYTVTLNPSLDYYLSLPALHPGTLHRVQDAQLLPGGKGVNVAIVLSRLGVPVRALGFAAGHTGALLTTLLREIGLDTDFVTVPDGMTRLNVKISTESETELNGAGPYIPSDAFEALLCKMDGLEPDDILVFTGSAPGRPGTARTGRAPASPARRCVQSTRAAGTGARCAHRCRHDRPTAHRSAALPSLPHQTQYARTGRGQWSDG